MSLTAAALVNELDLLPKGTPFNYVNESTKTVVEIQEIIFPEGPIFIKRYNPEKVDGAAKSKSATISVEMLWRIGNAFSPNIPINFDRVLAASYNTRSALEALLAHTPQFYVCYPGRIEVMESSSHIQQGHKHLLWTPDAPHPLGEMRLADTDIVISEIPQQVVYDPISISPLDVNIGDPEIKRRHALVQVALMEIGRQFGFRTWIAKNDHGIMYQDRPLSEAPDVVTDLAGEPLIGPQKGAVKAASYIDCIWFKNHVYMPAVMEVEHSTGVTSGLTRMKGLQDTIPSINTRYVVVAPDEDRERVVSEAYRPQFKSLRTQYFPYSAVEELLWLCRRRNIGKQVATEFVDAYMEQIV